MNMEKLVIRKMRNGEEKQVAGVGRKAFSSFEALFVGTPKLAMIAEYEGSIAGGIIYKFLDTNARKVAYIDEAFVAREFHGMGIGRRLYTETFRYLWEQGCDEITALVKDDNVASWKLCTDNGFKRVSLTAAASRLGMVGMAKQCIKTPLLIATGMDFYMASKEEPVQEKGSGLSQIAAFILANILLLFPMWIQMFDRRQEQLLYSLPAYLTVLVLFLLPRLVGAYLHRTTGRFRFNNGGAATTLLLSLVGNTFPMGANWYPLEYENNDRFRRRLAVPELIKWILFILLSVLSLSDHPYLRSTGQISTYFLCFMLIPLYPFEAMGAGRIFRYSKVLWFATAAITLAVWFLSGL